MRAKKRMIYLRQNKELALGRLYLKKIGLHPATVDFEWESGLNIRERVDSLLAEHGFRVAGYRASRTSARIQEYQVFLNELQPWDIPDSLSDYIC
ncbi:hypothetical protein ACPV5S_15820 [Vibrio astriarenae]